MLPFIDLSDSRLRFSPKRGVLFELRLSFFSAMPIRSILCDKSSTEDWFRCLKSSVGSGNSFRELILWSRQKNLFYLSRLRPFYSLKVLSLFSGFSIHLLESLWLKVEFGSFTFYVNPGTDNESSCLDFSEDGSFSIERALHKFYSDYSSETLNLRSKDSIR